MSSEKDKRVGEESLRLRALARLTGKSDPKDTRANSAAALAILHDLASSPATAADSLKLLHELQVNQVELDLQEEELRRSMAELEEALNRQLQLYEFSPAASFIVDRSATLCELNRTGASLLGHERDAVLGRTLDSFLEPDSSRALHALLMRVGDGVVGDGCELRFAARDGVSRSAYASVGPEPSGQRFLVACVEIREPRSLQSNRPS
jgi:PAS domain S-box-containing protein